MGGARLSIPPPRAGGRVRRSPSSPSHTHTTPLRLYTPRPPLPPPHLPPPRLWDWLKLEDINVSLYFVTWVW